MRYLAFDREGEPAAFKLALRLYNREEGFGGVRERALPADLRRLMESSLPHQQNGPRQYSS